MDHLPNSQHLSPGRDMGNDGHTSGNNTSIMPDVFGYSLGYFGADYEPIGTGVTDITGKALFNGNISQATYAIGLLNNGETVGNSYQYDQLNRLLRVNRHTAITAGSSWSNGSIATPFGENFSYDANGNIIALTRNNNTGQVLDQLSYSYNRNELDKLVNNKLRDVQDPSRPQVADNYTYDEIGNLTADEAEGLASISWTVYGKIRQITKTNGSTITYSYDPSGNRVRKVVTQAGGSNPQTTFYTRDAQGNTMAVYEQTATTYKWAEQHLYGSSRLGIFKPAFEVASSQPLGSDAYSDSNDPAANGIFGKKFFELSNHLGNVMVSVSDRTVQQLVGGNLVYRAEELSAQDYFAFGGLMPGRQVSVSDYRYGFNGKENDNEVKGTGNQQDYGMRIYDPRLARFLSVDPLMKSFPWNSTYAYAEGSPILHKDLDGGEKIHFQRTKNDGKPTLTYLNSEDFYEAKWSPGGTGLSNWWLWKVVKNPRIEYVVHQEREGTWEKFDKVQFVTYDETWTYGSYEDMLLNRNGNYGGEKTQFYIAKGLQAINEENRTVGGGGGGLNWANAIRRNSGKATSVVQKYFAKATSFIRTETIGGNKASRAVADIMRKMKAGEQMDPIEVFEHGGKSYVVDGHHRLEAATRLGKEIEFKTVTLEQLQQRGSFKSAEEIFNAAAESSGQRIKLDNRIINKIVNEQ